MTILVSILVLIPILAGILAINSLMNPSPHVRKDLERIKDHIKPNEVTHLKRAVADLRASRESYLKLEYETMKVWEDLCHCPDITRIRHTPHDQLNQWEIVLQIEDRKHRQTSATYHAEVVKSPTKPQYYGVKNNPNHLYEQYIRTPDGYVPFVTVPVPASGSVTKILDGDEIIDYDPSAPLPPGYS